MIEFTELSEGLSLLEARLDELLVYNKSSQQEVQEHIDCARTHLKTLCDQVQELSEELDLKEKENKLLLYELNEVLKVRNQLALKKTCSDVAITTDELNETEILIQVNEELQEEIKVLKHDLSKKEKDFQDLFSKHHSSENIIISENKALKNENKSLRFDIKSLTQNYNKVKKDFLDNVECLKALKLKLIEHKKDFQVNEDLLKEKIKVLRYNLSNKEKELQNLFHKNSTADNDVINENLSLKNENKSLKNYIQSLTHNYSKIKEDFHSNVQSLHILKLKLLEEKNNIQINEKLTEERKLLMNNLEDSKLSVQKYKEQVEEINKKFQDALSNIELRDIEIVELKSKLEYNENLSSKEINKREKHLENLRKECYELKEEIFHISNQMFENCLEYEDEKISFEDVKEFLVFLSIHYNIDVEYLKSVLNNRENYIKQLLNELDESKKAKIVKTKNAEVSAIVNTSDVGILAIDETENKKVISSKGLDEIISKILEHISTYKERNQNPCDSKDIDDKKNEESYVSKLLSQIDHKISGLLSEVKEFYETSIHDLHKKYKLEAENFAELVSFSETRLAKLKYSYESNLKYMRKQHDEKVLKLLARHEEELKNMSIYQQKVHSLKEKISKGKKKSKA